MHFQFYFEFPRITLELLHSKPKNVLDKGPLVKRKPLQNALWGCFCCLKGQFPLLLLMITRTRNEPKACDIFSNPHDSQTLEAGSSLVGRDWNAIQRGVLKLWPVESLRKLEREWGTRWRGWGMQRSLWPQTSNTCTGESETSLRFWRDNLAIITVLAFYWFTWSKEKHGHSSGKRFS